MQTVLQNWSHKQALIILENVLCAMSKDSTLLVNENVLSEAKDNRWSFLMQPARRVQSWESRVPMVRRGVLLEALSRL